MDKYGEGVTSRGSSVYRAYSENHVFSHRAHSVNAAGVGDKLEKITKGQISRPMYTWLAGTGR